MLVAGWTAVGGEFQFTAAHVVRIRRNTARSRCHGPGKTADGPFGQIDRPLKHVCYVLTILMTLRFGDVLLAWVDFTSRHHKVNNVPTLSL